MSNPIDNGSDITIIEVIENGTKVLTNILINIFGINFQIYRQISRNVRRSITNMNSLLMKMMILMIQVTTRHFLIPSLLPR